MASDNFSFDWSLLIRLGLEHKGIRWISHEVNLLDGVNSLPGFFQINPRGLVPVLVHDGITVVESSDIMLYIENNFPTRPLHSQNESSQAEMKTLLSLADAAHEPVFCLALHYYYGNKAKKSYNSLQGLRQFCCTDRQIYELHVLHNDGFEESRLREYIRKLHSCFTVLEQKLGEGRANLLGADITLADFSWAPLVHQALLMNFPMHAYPHIQMWFDIIEHSNTWQRAVGSWEKPWLQRSCALRVGFNHLLGQGIEGTENNYFTSVWVLPMFIFMLLIFVFMIFPTHGVMTSGYLSVPRSLLLYCLTSLLVGAVILAFHHARQPRPLPQRTSDRYMRAVACVDYGGPDMMRLLHHHPCPAMTRTDDVRITVFAASVSPADIKLRAGQGHHSHNYHRHKFQLPSGNGRELPLVLGRDFSGVVTEVSSGVDNLQPGDQVYGTVPAWYPGTLAEYISVPSSWVSIKPSNIQHTEAASVPYAGCVALQALGIQCVAGKEKQLEGKKILIVGCGGVGSLALQLAVSEGANVTVVCSEEGEKVAKRLGAHDTVNYQTHHFETVLQDQRFDFAILTVCTSNILSSCFALASKGGSVVNLVHSYEQLTSDYGVVLGSAIAWMKSVRMVMRQRLKYGIIYKEFKFNHHSLRRQLEMLQEKIESGKIIPVVERTHTMADYFQGFRYVSLGKAHGKTVINIRPRE